MKKGCIKIQRHTYENDWHIVGQIFQQFKPFHIGFDGVKDQWVFTGTCDSFDDVPEHLPAPEYHTTIHSNAVTFQRAELPKNTGPGLLPLAMQILKDELQKNDTKNTAYHTWKIAIQAAIIDRFEYGDHTKTLQDLANETADKALQNIINLK